LMDSTPLFLRAKMARIIPMENFFQTFTAKITGLIHFNSDNQAEQRKMYDYYTYDFEQLASIPLIPGKKFVYAHFLTTHRPFLFAKDGSFFPNPSNEGYVDSIQFTNKAILDSIDKIITTSSPKPIIVIQGDHSLPGSHDAYGILNAYYFPENGGAKLYPSVSPVNTFRIIFNDYFGGNFSLLPDNSFWMYEYRRKIIPDLQENTCD
jgi:hypothetical protein